MKTNTRPLTAYAKNMLISNYKQFNKIYSNSIYTVYGRCSDAKINSYEHLQKLYNEVFDTFISKITAHNTFYYTLCVRGCVIDNNTEKWYFEVDTANNAYICGLSEDFNDLIDLSTGEIFYSYED